MVCDWLLNARTEIWQEECAVLDDSSSDDGKGKVSSSAISAADLVAFQRDLASLRKLAQNVKAVMPRVSFVIVVDPSRL